MGATRVTRGLRWPRQMSDLPSSRKWWQVPLGRRRRRPCCRGWSSWACKTRVRAPAPPHAGRLRMAARFMVVTTAPGRGALAVVAELRATEALAVLRSHAAERPLTLTFCAVPSGRGKLVQVGSSGHSQMARSGAAHGPSPAPVCATTASADANAPVARQDGPNRQVAFEDFQNARKGLLTLVANEPGSQVAGVTTSSANEPNQVAVQPQVAELADPYAAYRTA